MKDEMKEVFTDIFSSNMWGSSESVSGKGSTKESTQGAVDAVNIIINEYKISSMLDIPCGDFNWMKNVNFKNINYIGADIVDKLVEDNNTKYSDDNISFEVLDITKDELPKSDLVVVRDCFVHLPNNLILKAIKNIISSGSKYLLTTTFLEHQENSDIRIGGWHSVNINSSPFNLPRPIAIYKDKDFHSMNREYDDKALVLIDLRDIEQRIFVQIASYRDPELPKTIKSCIDNADHPENLRFGIVNQYDNDTHHIIDEWRNDPRFRIVELPWQDSQGVGVARNIACSLWLDEEFMLQIDAHSRFESGWDSDLINQWYLCDDQMAVLSSCAPPWHYDANNSETLSGRTSVVSHPAKQFLRGNLPHIKSFLRAPQDKPLLNGFMCGNMFFSRGQVNKNVPYVRDICFTGEEMVRSALLFTHGYNIYAPAVFKIYHLNKRLTSRFWNDMTDELQKTQDEMHRLSSEAVQQILVDQKHPYIGGKRTINDFETFAGINFEHQIVSEKHEQQIIPPFETDPLWYKQYKTIDIKFDLPNTILDKNVKEYGDWHYQIYNDLQDKIFSDKLKKDVYAKNRLEFDIQAKLASQPSYIIITPYIMDSKKWGKQYRFEFKKTAEGIYSAVK